jgi:hypothetical protein
MFVVSICFKCFQVFYTYVCKCFIWMLHMFVMVFKCFSGVFTGVLDICFKCFICLGLYVATIVSGCFKSRSSVAHGMRVRSSRRRGPAAGTLPHGPDALGARSFPVRAASRC